MNLKELKDLIDLINSNDITEFEIEEEGKKIKIRKGGLEQADQITKAFMQTPIISGSIQQPSATFGKQQEVSEAKQGEEQKNENAIEIVSPMVGTFYRSSSPDAAPYVKEGDIINEGQTVCIIEAMKLMNEVKAEFKCKIIKILVENGNAVEYSQPIFLVEKT